MVLKSTLLRIENTAGKKVGISMPAGEKFWRVFGMVLKPQASDKSGLGAAGSHGHVNGDHRAKAMALGKQAACPSR
jgi:hypothetical protein